MTASNGRLSGTSAECVRRLGQPSERPPTMKTDTSKLTTDPCRRHLSIETIFRLLSDDRRRHLLDYLGEKVGAVAISDAAEQIALVEGDLSRDRFERIVTGLYHVHLPVLAQTGVVRYDLEAETIERLAPADDLTPYLTLAAADVRR